MSPFIFLNCCLPLACLFSLLPSLFLFSNASSVEYITCWIGTGGKLGWGGATLQGSIKSANSACYHYQVNCAYAGTTLCTVDEVKEGLIKDSFGVTSSVDFCNSVNKGKVNNVNILSGLCCDTNGCNVAGCMCGCGENLMRQMSDVFALEDCNVNRCMTRSDHNAIVPYVSNQGPPTLSFPSAAICGDGWQLVAYWNGVEVTKLTHTPPLPAIACMCLCCNHSQCKMNGYQTAYVDAAYKCQPLFCQATFSDTCKADKDGFAWVNSLAVTQSTREYFAVTTEGSMYCECMCCKDSDTCSPAQWPRLLVAMPEGKSTLCTPSVCALNFPDECPSPLVPATNGWNRAVLYSDSGGDWIHAGQRLYSNQNCECDCCYGVACTRLFAGVLKSRDPTLCTPSACNTNFPLFCPKPDALGALTETGSNVALYKYPLNGVVVAIQVNNQVNPMAVPGVNEQLTIEAEQMAPPKEEVPMMCVTGTGVCWANKGDEIWDKGSAEPTDAAKEAMIVLGMVGGVILIVGVGLIRWKFYYKWGLRLEALKRQVENNARAEQGLPPRELPTELKKELKSIPTRQLSSQTLLSPRNHTRTDSRTHARNDSQRSNHSRVPSQMPGGTHTHIPTIGISPPEHTIAPPPIAGHVHTPSQQAALTGGLAGGFANLIAQPVSSPRAPYTPGQGGGSPAGTAAFTPTQDMPHPFAQPVEPSSRAAGKIARVRYAEPEQIPDSTPPTPPPGTYDERNVFTAPQANADLSASGWPMGTGNTYADLDAVQHREVTQSQKSHETVKGAAGSVLFHGTEGSQGVKSRGASDFYGEDVTEPEGQAESRDLFAGGVGRYARMV